jgi:hypothetical protein
LPSSLLGRQLIDELKDYGEAVFLHFSDDAFFFSVHDAPEYA